MIFQYVCIPIAVYMYTYILNHIPNQPSISKDLQLDYKCRVISMINGMICYFGTLLYYFNNNILFLKYCLYSSIGYFLVDSYHLHDLFSINKLSGTILFSIHHMYAVYGIINYSDTHLYLLARIFVCEVTNIFLNITWLMYKTKNNNTFLLKSCGLLTIITYFFTRILNFTHLVFYTALPGSTRSIIFIFTCINYFWFYKILKIFFKF